MEDVAIAYGFNNIKHTIPKTNTFGQQFPLNKLTDLLRREVSFAGFTEVLTFALVYYFTYSQEPKERKRKMRKVKERRKKNPSKISARPMKTVVFSINLKPRKSAPKYPIPKRQNFRSLISLQENEKNQLNFSLHLKVARTTLLPGILKTAASNKKMPLPLKLFEIADVVIKDPSKDVGARNSRKLCALYLNTTANFEVLARQNEIKRNETKQSKAKQSKAKQSKKRKKKKKKEKRKKKKKKEKRKEKRKKEKKK